MSKINVCTLTKESLRRKNFAPDDFFVSETAKKLKIDNETDSLAILTCLMLTADKAQEIRDLLGYPLLIDSAYRCKKLNDAVKGSKNSQHMQGQAIDFICPKFGKPKKIVEFLKKNNIVVDQCILEKSWVHLSIKHNQNRNQFLTII